MSWARPAPGQAARGGARRGQHWGQHWPALAVVAAFVALAVAGHFHPQLLHFPDAWVLPLAPVLNAFMGWFVDGFGFVFKGISWLMDWPVKAAQVLLQGLPWVLVLYLAVVLARLAGGWRLAGFTLATGLYILALGYWQPSMNTLALVAISVPLSVAVGFALGVWGFYAPGARRVIMPLLDVMQTVPAFAYLIPILLLFGFGTTVGLVASVLYAFAPMVRNTIVGLEGVSPAIVESGLMSGANGRQLFWQVRLPAALRQVLLGVNQTTMAALSMVVIASIIGGTNDIGWEVIRTMRKAQFGDSVLAGIVIALIAMIMDRISWGLAMQAGRSHLRAPRPLRRRRQAMVALGAGGLALAAWMWPALWHWPQAWQAELAPVLNRWVADLVTGYGALLKAVKNSFFFYVMLPVKSGLLNTVKPFTWGFELAWWHVAAYWALAVVAGLWAARRIAPAAGLGLVVAMAVYFLGLTNIPWLAHVLLIVFVAWAAGGARLALGVAAGLAFLLLTGSWDKAVLSLYITLIAVVGSFTLGTLIGIWAAENDRVSAIVRPIADTLQTIPMFVILIPFVMLFRIGEFSALLAICAYAIVPAIRYAEHGLRNLPAPVLEAATSLGTTRWQKLVQVKLPMAAPVLLLGLNQTIMYAISMLVIAALVGTNGLGQQVYIGLSDGDFGVGIIAGIGMAILAMSADRITSAWSRRLRGVHTSAPGP